jgi:hypothetical protein
LSVQEVLAALGGQRPVFHSEADFQHALTWEIHMRLPHASVRLERPVAVTPGDIPLHVDVWVQQDRNIGVLELKYKTRTLRTTEKGEAFLLQNQGAQDIGRYDFIKEVWRTETIVANDVRATGNAVLLTNDPSYWTPPRSDRTVDADLRLYEGRELRGSLGWGTQASDGTKRGRENNIQLTGHYSLRWEDYSQASAEAKARRFRYLVAKAEIT